MTHIAWGADGKALSHSIKAYAIFLALLVGTLFTTVARAQRTGNQVNLWDLQFGAFDWKMDPTPQPDGTVHFHVVLTILPSWPEVSLTHGPSATLSHADFDPDHGYQIVRDLRPLKLTIHGKSAQCDFAVTKEELADPNLCFAFSLWEQEKKEHADFALLNDFFNFPKSAIGRLGDAKVQDRRVISHKLASACSLARDAVDWEKMVPSLIPHLNDPDEQVRESIVQALIVIRKPADKIVPALIQILDAHSRAMFADPADERIIHGLDKIEPRWYDRPEFNGNVRNYAARFPQSDD